MGFVTDLIDHATGASSMNNATDLQRSQFEYFKQLSEEDRKALQSLYDKAQSEGFFDWQKRLDMYDKAVDPQNQRDMRNVGAILRQAGARQGDTNTDASAAMVLRAQKNSRGEAAMNFFDRAFKDQFAIRSAMAGNNNPLMAQSAQTLSQTLMNQGQQQAGQFNSLLQYASPFLFKGKGKMPGGGGAKPGFSGITNWGEGSGGGVGGNMPSLPNPQQPALPAPKTKWVS